MQNISKTSFSFWPYAIMASFVLLAIFDAFIISAAYRTKTGVVEDSPYQAGLSYDRIIKAKTETLKAGLKLQLTNLEGNLEFDVLGDLPAASKQLTVKLIRPDAVSLDREYKLASDTNIFKVANAQHFKPGLWLLKANLLVGEIEYYFESREVL